MASNRDLLRELIPKLGGRSLAAADGALRELQAEADEPWKKAIIKTFADALEKNGPDGLKKAEEAVGALIGGREVDLDFVSLRTASDLLAVMQNLEARQKSKARNFTRRFGQVIGRLIGSILRGVTG